MTHKFVPADLRRTVLRMAYAGATVHVGCAFSLIEICSVLYRSHLRYPNQDPRDPARDYLVLSKGHGVMAQYACMYELGWLKDEDIDGYFGDGTRLKGLSDAHVPGCEVTSGSLGHGMSVGIGLALAAKLRGTDQRVYAIVGDGEMNEGPIWEAMLLANHHRLDNFVLIIDENGFQAMGPTEEVLDLGDIAEKLRAFGFDAHTVDGHDELALDRTLNAFLRAADGRPKAIVARTVKGKGVSFMENDNTWHYMRLNGETYEQAVAELAKI